jgi:hypothetical protein
MKILPKTQNIKKKLEKKKHSNRKNIMKKKKKLKMEKNLFQYSQYLISLMFSASSYIG